MQHRTAAIGLSVVAALMITALASHWVVADPAAPAPATPSATPSATQASDNSTTTTADGLKITTTKAPDDAAKVGDTVWVHYSGKLADGTEFDNSYKRGEPIQLTLGEGRVIKGWEEGLLGMKVGEKRTLVIPPELAYGAEGRSPIPPNATLTFDVELMGLKR